MSEPRTILVSGLSRGLGRAMAKSFAERGHRVAGCARNREALEKLQAELGEPHFLRLVDVSDDEAVAKFAETVLREVGVPDMLVNCAGIINRNAPLWEVPSDEFSKVVDVNIKGVANMIRHFVPAMIANGSGIIVNFSSGWGRSTSPEVAPYCATKWAIEGLTRALAQELPPGLAAVPFNPGVIDTEMLRSCFGDTASSYPNAEEWANTAVPFLEQIGADDNGTPLTCPGH
ncbi:MAG: SDR family oxidoreductase [Verrucomicrobiales bacterium]